MSELPPPAFKVAVVWRGGLEDRATATPDNNRLHAIFTALARQGVTAEPAGFCEEAAAHLPTQLPGLDGVQPGNHFQPGGFPAEDRSRLQRSFQFGGGDIRLPDRPTGDISLYAPHHFKRGGDKDFFAR